MPNVHVSYAGHLSDRVQDLYYDRIRPEGVDLHFISLLPFEAFHRLIAGEFDAGEMSLSTFIVKVSRGEHDLVAIPVFPSRTFRHNAIYVAEASGIERPEDLAGRRVGVPEYHMTAALWVRGLLEHEYGVPPDAIDWFTGGLRDAGRRPLVQVEVPGVRVSHVADRSLDEMLRVGDLDAIIAPQAPPSFTDGEGARRLFEDYPRVEAAYFRKTGIFPIMHTLVLRRELYDAHPWVAVSLFRAFDRARAAAMERLQVREPPTVSLPWVQHALDETMTAMGPDFWPYGVEPNRTVLATACQYSAEQGLTDRLVDVDELFAPNVSGGKSLL